MKSRTYMCFICLLFWVCFSLQVVRADDDLSIKISTDKGSYTIGKPIELKIKITNTSNQSIKISTLRLSPKIRIAKILHIQSPDGKTLVSMAQTGGGRLKNLHLLQRSAVVKRYLKQSICWNSFQNTILTDLIISMKQERTQYRQYTRTNSEMIRSGRAKLHQIRSRLRWNHCLRSSSTS